MKWSNNSPVSSSDKNWIYLGRVGRPCGVRGEMHLTLPEGVGGSLAPGVRVRLDSKARSEERVVESLRSDGKNTVVRLRGVADRDAAARLTHAELFIRRADLPPAREGEFYFADVEGARVVGPAGEALGEVTGVWEGGGAFYLVCDTPQGEAYLPVKAAREIAPARGVVTADATALIHPDEVEE